MRRRAFLHHTALAGLALLGGPLRRARAQSPAWGEFPTGSAAADYWPSGTSLPSYKILEIHLSGGLSPYETFHVDTGSGISDRWFNHAASVAAIDYSGCTNPPASSTSVEPFAGSVNLGPVAHPLWAYKNRLRVVVLRHNLEPHEAAIPYSLTGLPIGNPKFAGLGTAMEHRFDRAISMKTTPNSYVLIPGNLGIDEDSFRGFFATGIHGGQYQPLVLRIPTLPAGQTSIRDQALLDALDRTGFGSGQDDLLAHYAAQYRDRLRHRRAPAQPARSGGFSGYESALATLLNAPNLKGVLNTAIQPVTRDTSCVDSGLDQNLPRAALRTAAQLLTLPESMGGARYVGLVDGGIRGTTGGGYDVHAGAQYPRMFTNLWNCLSNLAEVIHDPATPAAVDPNKINLRETMVILNTEFGRTPSVGDRGGRDHYPNGYVNVFLGGPVVGPQVAGRILATGAADMSLSFTAADTRAAALMAAGINPFADENFGVGDVGQNIRTMGRGSEPGCARALRQNILGVS